MTMQQATQSCFPCKRLKRKCTRERPSCSLCIRLAKSCQYPANRQRSGTSNEEQYPSQPNSFNTGPLTPKSCYSSKVSFPPDFSQSTESVTNSTSAESIIHPAIYLIEPSLHVPGPADQCHSGFPVPSEILQLLRRPVVTQNLYLTHLNGIHHWLPILSPKRLSQRISNFNSQHDVTLSLLLLCIRLVNEITSTSDVFSISPLYWTVKGLQSKIEGLGLVSLQLLQATVLIAVYEIGNGIYPAAYLSVGHAARLGMMLGFHDRQSSMRFFKEADTWTQSEEERRTWWAITILDRYISLGTPDLPLATPTPPNATLLPCIESTWDSGLIAPNEPLFANSFTDDTPMGIFASACQASHILSHVLQHRYDHKSGTNTDPQFQLAQALQLHQALTALHEHVNHAGSGDKVLAQAFCHSARLILYGIYACNDATDHHRLRIAEEITMQRAALQGIKDVLVAVFALAQRIEGGRAAPSANLFEISPLLCHCLADAASECAWFVREDDSVVNVEMLRVMVNSLRSLEKRWKVAGLYLKCLEKEGDLAALVE